MGELFSFSRNIPCEAQSQHGFIKKHSERCPNMPQHLFQGFSEDLVGVHWMGERFLPPLTTAIATNGLFVENLIKKGMVSRCLFSSDYFPMTNTI